MAKNMRVDYFSKDYLLSPDVRSNCIRAFSQSPVFNIFSNVPEQKAAVLIPMCLVDGKMSILYTVRSSNLSSFSGDVSFPGGKADPSDKNLIETALRETEEELGLSRSDVDVWGIGNYYVTLSKIAIYPVVGYIRNYKYENLRPNVGEVDKVFTLPIEHMCSPKNIQSMQFQKGKYAIPTYSGGPENVWGITAFMTHVFFISLFPDSVYNSDLMSYPIVSKL